MIYGLLNTDILIVYDNYNENIRLMIMEISIAVQHNIVTLSKLRKKYV